jgi:hypothetical protein
MQLFTVYFPPFSSYFLLFVPDILTSLLKLPPLILFGYNELSSTNDQENLGNCEIQCKKRLES